MAAPLPRFALLLMAASLVAAPSAQAAPLVRVGPVASGVVSDQERWLAYGVKGRRQLRVLDTFSGRSRRIPRPRRCEHVRGFAGTRLIQDCRGSDGYAYPRLFSIRTGRPLRLHGAEELVRRMVACHAEMGCSAYPAGWGRHWLRTQWWDNSGSSTVITYDYTNVRTGRVRGPTTSATEIEDIDHPGLVRRMCRPFRRTPIPGEALAHELFQPFSYAPPYGLSARPEGFSVLRCGRARPLLRRGSGPRALQLTRHHAVWLTRDRGTGRRRLHVMRLATRRRASWVVERYLGRLTIPAYTMTRDWLYVTDFRGLEERRLVLYRAALP